MYTNPRMHAEIPDWPSGHHRTTATFTIETHPTRGMRCVRTTINPKTGKPSAPKALTYARQARIVDGDDGRTYILELTLYGFISVMEATMQGEHERPYFPDHPDYPALRALFD